MGLITSKNLGESRDLKWEKRMLTTQSPRACSRNKFTSQWGIVDTSMQAQQPCQAHLLPPPHASSLALRAPQPSWYTTWDFLCWQPLCPCPCLFLPGKHLQKPVNHHFWSFSHLPKPLSCPNWGSSSFLWCPTAIIAPVLNKRQWEDFLGNPVTKTPHSQYRGPGLDPWSGN